VRLVSLGYANDFTDEQRIAAGPIEFARTMGGARAVITNFFHGCVFALINGKASLQLAMDYDLWWRLYRRCGKPNCRHRQHAPATTTSASSHDALN